MRALLLLCAVVCISGVAIAQDTASTSTSAAFDPDFEPLSSGQAWNRLYPIRATERGVSGFAFLCCGANSDRSLACRVAYETPEDYGFGDAALYLASRRRLTVDGYAALQARPVQQFAIPVRYHTVPAPASFEALSQQARDNATDLCGAGTGPAPDYITVTVEGVRRAGDSGGSSHGAHNSRSGLGH